MRIFIVEDDINVIKILEKIIKDRNLGILIGYAEDGLEGFKEIQTLKPDIILVDLFMPGMDGISLVNKAKAINPEYQFIMISQVTSKEMIGKAYESGVEYYIHKPVNAIEVENVIKKVIERIEINKTLNHIKGLFVDKVVVSNNKPDNDYDRKIKNVMNRIGIMGETGSKDIIEVTKYLIQCNKNMSEITIKELCNEFSDNPKSMEQRIRRTATIGMINLAYLGIEDYMNETFVEYSNGLYSFEQVKKEMDFIRKKSKKRGKVNLKKFIDGIVFYSIQ